MSPGRNKWSQVLWRKHPTPQQSTNIDPSQFLACAIEFGVRSEQVLQHLQTLAPATCTGNLPGRFATQVWYGVMQDIEVSHMSGGSLTGWVIDLIQAFNALPRTPILHFMAILRVCPRIMRAWGHALVSMERRFKLHNGVGPSLLSSTGFPEGCALSVTAMLAHNLLAHFYVQLRFPSVRLWSC